MTARRLTAACTLFLTACAWAQAQPANPDARVESLVRKLGSSSFVQREQARLALEAIGPAALESLRGVKKTTDAETNCRIAELVRLFEQQVLTQQILAPKLVNLKLKEASVQQAISELNNQGYPVQFQGDATRFADKKINLEGKLSYWQALDQVCEQAGLMERIDPNTLAQPNPNLGFRRNAMPMPAPTPTGPILLTLRGNAKSLVSYTGAVKTEVRITRDAGTKDLTVQFIVSAEPRLLNYAIVARPVLDKALDDRGRKLLPSVEVSKASAKTSEKDQGLRELERLAALGAFDYGMPQINHRVTQIRVKEEHAAKQLKELAGQLTLQLDQQNEILARVDKVMGAAGKSVDASSGGTMKVVAVEKSADKTFTINLALENTAANPFGGNIIFNGNGGVVIRGNVIINGGGMVIGPNGVRINGGANGSRSDLPDLVDAIGQKFQIISTSNDSFNFVNGASSRTVTVVYRQGPTQGEPTDLVLFGTRTHTIAVPFRFENLPLP